MGFFDFGFDFGNFDFVKYVESYGVVGYWVESVDELFLLLEKCFNMGGVYVVDLFCDYFENDCILNYEICEWSV